MPGRVYPARSVRFRQDRNVGRRAVSSAVVAVLLLPACSGERVVDDGAEAGRLQAASQGICDAQAFAAEGDVEGARTIFEEGVHDYLHQLAVRLRETDRAAAGRLLEVTQRMEDAFRTRVDPASLTALLGDLQRALIEGAEAAGLPQPLCREGAV
jgi:predicted HicB family RNase H-like nuclease